MGDQVTKKQANEKAAAGNAKVEALSSEAKQDIFASTVYEKINATIGGNNPNEKLCLLLPGFALNKKDFEYDYAHNAEKGPVVSANESRLANKLYDPYDLVGSDNGKTLDRQYRSALNLLSPRLNSIIVNAKNDLRRFLMTEFPYSFEGEEEKTYTFQEVYFRLYQDYIDAMKAWANEQSEKKDEISRRIKAKWARVAGKGGEEYSEEDSIDEDFVNVVLPEDPDEQAYFIKSETNREINNEYLSWYEINAESRLAEVNKKMSAVLSVFSANDMKILEGILDTGSGAELQEAREMLNNTRKRNPDGGYVYPVKFSPSNWFEYLDTSFTPVDLLNNPETYLDELDLCYSRRDALQSQIESISSRIPDDDKLKELQAEYEKSKASLREAETALQKAGVDGFTGFAKTLVTSVSRLWIFKGASVATNTAKKVMSNMAKSKKKQEEKNGRDCDSLTKRIAEDVDALIDSLCKGGSKVNEAQDKVMAAMDNYSKRAIDYFASKNMTQLKDFLEPIMVQKTELDRKIEMLENKLGLAYSASAATYKDDGSLADPSTNVNPPETPNGFSQVTIISSYKNASGESSSKTTVTRNSSRKGFWVFKKSKTSTSESSEFEKFCESESTEIHIGMNIAKVGIERSWFDPGVFTLTKEMFSLGKQDENTSVNDLHAETMPIALGNPGELNDDATMQNLASCVLPCYPTALVVARDVTIKVVNKADASNSVALSSSETESTSKGFFVFNSSSSTSTSSEASNYSCFSSDNCVTMKFASPQVIGYYLQYVEKDESLPYPSDEKDLKTIGGFVSSYLKLIKDMKEARAKLTK